MIFGIIGIALLGYAFNYICYSILTDYCIYQTVLKNRKKLVKRILLIVFLVPFLLCVLTIAYGITIVPVKIFLKEWRGE